VEKGQRDTSFAVDEKQALLLAIAGPAGPEACAAAAAYDGTRAGRKWAEGAKRCGVGQRPWPMLPQAEGGRADGSCWLMGCVRAHERGIPMTR
jgi:hypothetical protein